MNTATASSAPAAWRLTGHSVRGAAHVRGDLPNQDAVALWPSAGTAAAASAIAAVADGHGGARHFRSATGSRIAVDVSLRVLQTVAAQLEALPAAHACAAARQAMASLPHRIVDAWTLEARAHLASAPITAAEWRSVSLAEGDGALATVEADPLLAYGATLLTALATPDCIVLLQLGDGDVLAVGADGSTTRPVPADPRLAGNFTTSICRADAADDFRCAVLPLDERAPALLLLSTDGYANSFKTDDDFLKLGTDFLGLTRDHGLARVGEQLETILHDASTRGSGDDITLAMLQRDLGGIPQATGDALPIATPQVAAQPADLQLTHRRIRTLRATTAVLALALCASIAWGWRDSLRRLWTHEPVLAGAPEHQPPPEPAPPRKDAAERLIGPAPGAPLASPAPASPAAAAPVGDSPLVASIGGERVRAHRIERGIQVEVDLSGISQRGAGCAIHAAVWGPAGVSLATVSERLGESPDGKSAADMLQLLVPYPLEKLRARAMQQSGATFSVRIDCDKQTIARTERLAVQS